ncbi:hypothetical protein ACMHYB_01370 [Sorangium sp. So ce1128]
MNFPWNFELRDRIEAELVRLGRSAIFSPLDVAARATTQSCAGCHQLSDGASLGNGVTWPRKEPEKPVAEQEFRFVHVREDGELSQALTHSFLPHRDGILKAFLAAHADQNTCSPAALRQGNAVPYVELARRFPYRSARIEQTVPAMPQLLVLEQGSRCGATFPTGGAGSRLRGSVQEQT